MTSPYMPERSVTTYDLFNVVTATRNDVSTVLTDVEVMSAQQALTSAQLSDIELRLRTVQAAVPDGLAARLTAVERWQWRTSGALAAIGMAFGLLGGWLGTLIAHLH
jgi:hypothetical protein